MQKQLIGLLLIIVSLSFAGWHVTELQTGNPNVYRYRVNLKLSPDKKNLLSIGGIGGTNHLLLYNLETGQEQILKDSVCLGDSPIDASWSSDSKKILYWTNEDSTSNSPKLKKYFIYNLETNEITFFKDIYRAAYSPVSDKIAFITKYDNIIIHKNETSLEDTIQFNHSGHFQWSKNSDSYLYIWKADSIISYNTTNNNYYTFTKHIFNYSGQYPWGGGFAFEPYVENDVEKIIYHESYSITYNDSLLFYNSATDTSVCIASHMNPHAGPWFIGETELFPNLKRVIYQERYITSYNAMPSLIDLDLETGSAFDIITQHQQDYGTWPCGFGYPMEIAAASDELFYFSHLEGSNDNLAACLSVSKFENSIEENNQKNNLLLTCYPNPFNPTTTISYNLTAEGFVKLHIFNSSGQIIKNIISSNQQIGSYHFLFNATGLASGIYYLMLETTDQRLCKKIMLVQ